MAQGKMKVKGKLPANVKNKTKPKGSAITKRSNAPIQTKKKNSEEATKIKKIISKNVNKKMEEDIRSMVLDRKTKFSKAQQAVIAHNSSKPPSTK